MPAYLNLHKFAERLRSSLKVRRFGAPAYSLILLVPVTVTGPAGIPVNTSARFMNPGWGFLVPHMSAEAQLAENVALVEIPPLVINRTGTMQLDLVVTPPATVGTVVRQVTLTFLNTPFTFTFPVSITTTA